MIAVPFVCKMAGYRFLNRYYVLTMYDSNLTERKAWGKGLHSPFSLSPDEVHLFFFTKFHTKK